MIDELPALDYPSVPVRATHPARLAAQAMVHGIADTFRDDFRLLEIGCGDGANLLPLAAAFPKASFVGFDRNARAIGVGEQVRRRAGIENLSLLPVRVEDWDKGAGSFDFIVAHGVFSWVPESTQEAIFELLKRHLAPNGVAYLSYNTLPGWAMRGVLRDAMRYATRNAKDAASTVVEARLLVERLSKLAPSEGHPYGALLRSELGFLGDKHPGHFFSEYLGEHNRPFYFHEVASAALRHGLEFVSELLPVSAEGEIELRIPAELEREGMSEVDAQQMLDFACYRQFRATLFCHAGARKHKRPHYGALRESGYLAGALRSKAEEPLLGAGKGLRFVTPLGAEIETSAPLLKAALLLLSERFPEGIRASELISSAISALRERGLGREAQASGEELSATVDDLIALCERRHLELLPWTCRVEREIAERPRVSALSRLEAEVHGWVCSPRHDPVMLEPLPRVVVSLLDGSRGPEALCRDVAAIVASEGISVGASEEDLPERVGEAVVATRDLGLLI